jgi:hypothetical protein
MSTLAPAASSTSSRPKVGLLFSGSMSPEMVDLIANTVHTSKGVDFYLLTDQAVKPFTPVEDPKLGALLSIRKTLMQNITGGGIFSPEVTTLIKDKPELVKDMIFIADNQEPSHILNASTKQAILLLPSDMKDPFVDVRIPEPARTLVLVPKDPLTSNVLLDTVSKVAISNRPAGSDHVSAFTRELQDADVFPINSQGIGQNKAFVNVYDPKSETVTFIHKAQKLAYSYTAKSSKLSVGAETGVKDYTLSKEQDAEFAKKLSNFHRIVKRGTELGR